MGALQGLVSETGATAVFWNRRYEPAVISRDAAVKSCLRDRGIEAESFAGNLLFEPWTVQSKSAQEPFQLFKAYWKACLNIQPAPPRDAPRRIAAPARWPQSEQLSDLRLEPQFDWTEGLRAAWTPGEDGARMALDRFAREQLNGYALRRDLPADTATSRLSPHLHFGEISARRIWHHLTTAPPGDGVDRYRNELGWREFGYHLLYHFPHATDEPLRDEFASFPWNRDHTLLKHWQRGATGYPLVDAGMRQLWKTGWMHNRVRMVVASFLTKHLRISWQEGTRWFWDTLVDADLANNTLGWQWSAGCGADAAPYFRIFNPVRQGQRFDPEGVYIRRYVPELAGLAAPWIHAPWEAPSSPLESAGVRLGFTYLRPIVEHKRARREALEAFEEMRRLRSKIKIIHYGKRS
jgi:deoxyribodipyrimidine photo-lyase